MLYDNEPNDNASGLSPACGHGYPDWFCGRCATVEVGPRHWGYSCAMLHYEGIEMDEEVKKVLLDAIMHSIREKVRAEETPPLDMKVQPNIEDADTLGEVLVNHNISLASKEFIVIADSAEDSTRCVSVLQVEKHTLRDIINKLIRAYRQLESYEAKEKKDV